MFKVFDHETKEYIYIPSSTEQIKMVEDYLDLSNVETDKEYRQLNCNVCDGQGGYLDFFGKWIYCTECMTT